MKDSFPGTWNGQERLRAAQDRGCRGVDDDLPRGIRSPKRAEEGTDVARDEGGDLEGGEVAALLEPAPVHDVGVVALGEDPDRLEVVGEDGDPGRRGVDAGLGARGIRSRVLEVAAAHARSGVREPVDADFHEDRVEGYERGAVAERVEELAVGEEPDGR